MNNAIDGLGVMTVVFMVTAVLQLIFFKKHVKNIADPLFYLLITSSFSLALGFYVINSIELYLRIIFYFFCFYFGLIFGVGRVTSRCKILTIDGGILQFKLIVVIGVALLFFANLIIWLKKGVIVFSTDPSLMKSNAFIGGLGIVRRINWGLGVFLLIATAYWFIWDRSKKSLFLLLLVIFINIANGSKSSLLPLLFSFGLYFLNPFSPLDRTKSIPDERILYRVFLFASIPVFMVFMIEKESLNQALIALLQRLFYFGDVLIYWSQDELRDSFSYFGISDYFLNTFGSILGFLRIYDYSAPVGNQFVRFTLPEGFDFPEDIGPNLPFYVRGELYFGAWFAPVHAFFVGLILGLVRKKFLRYQGNKLLSYSLMAFFVSISIVLPTEEGLAVGQIFDFLIIYMLIRFIVLGIELSLIKEGGVRAIKKTPESE